MSDDITDVSLGVPSVDKTATQIMLETVGKYPTIGEAMRIEAHRQLIMARYAMHKVRTKIYADRVVSGRLTVEQAAEEYRKAMENYDELMVIANEPGRIEACVDDMAKGFVMPDRPLWWNAEVAHEKAAYDDLVRRAAECDEFSNQIGLMTDNSPLENEPEGG